MLIESDLQIKENELSVTAGLVEEIDSPVNHITLPPACPTVHYAAVVSQSGIGPSLG
jgi:hypothetical protein